MNSKRRETESDHGPKIVRRRFDSLALFEITEDELTALAAGSPGSTHLNLAIACLSTAVSMLVALMSASQLQSGVFTVFVVVTVFGFGVGLVLVCLWLRSHSSVSDLVGKIRGRSDGSTGTDSRADDCAPDSKSGPSRGT